MRDVNFAMTQTQKVRLKRALQCLRDCSVASSPVIVADTIPVNLEDNILKGHGTAELEGEVVATLCGAVERVNKLVLVRPFRARYKPEIGDIVVGRVIEVAPKRWRLDINFIQDAILMLSSMNLPDGIQRRRTAVDELNMRSIFEENDVICAEVRGSQNDGSLHLQARSQKYGKLEKGQLLSVSPYLVKRRKQHFHHLEQYGVDLILGCNGYIWVGAHSDGGGKNEDFEDLSAKLEDKMEVEVSPLAPHKEEASSVPLGTRENVCRLANAIRILSLLGFNISMELILDTVVASVTWNTTVRDMLGGEFYTRIAEREAERRSSKRATQV